MYGDLVHRSVRRSGLILRKRGLHVGASARAPKGIGRARHQIIRAARTPASGLIVIARLALVAAVAVLPSLVGAAKSPTQDPAIRPLGAVMPDPANAEGLSVAWPPASSHSAASSIIAPPPPAFVSSPGALGIPAMALTAYRNAERVMAQAMPGCGVSWNLLAGVGRIESTHAFGGATDARGNPVNPIYGPALDGSLSGNEVIVQSRAAKGRTIYARAMGPMQFLPETWTRYASDGDGDGQANPQNLFDSTLAAARYLCSGGLNLRDRSQVITAVLRYNNSMPYTQHVLGWAAAYVTGVPPVGLPPITGPIRPIGNMRFVTAPTNVDQADDGPDDTRDGPGDDRTASDQAGGNGGPGSRPPPVFSSSGLGATKAGGNGGAAKSRTGVAPGVKVGNGRNGGARGTGG